jgi:hypothetical protein
MGLELEMTLALGLWDMVGDFIGVAGGERGNGESTGALTAAETWSPLRTSMGYARTVLVVAAQKFEGC